jgi:hypothetical protein
MAAFITTMANTVIDGQPAISATVVSYWQGFGEMSKTLGMFTGGYLPIDLVESESCHVSYRDPSIEKASLTRHTSSDGP